MNKHKIAIFVEGQAEYIFVREFLQKWYGYDPEHLGIECYAFRSDKTNNVPYPFGDRNSEIFYQIYNVGNDNSVLSKIMKNAERLKNAGFQLIIGLSDMFCDQYHKTSGLPRTIKEETNQLFIQKRQNIIKEKKLQDFVHYHFAIMEVEAWFLGMYQYLLKIDTKLTPKYILKNLDVNLNNDPETTIYHPAKVLDDIYGLVNNKYGKHESDINKITGLLDKTDFENLINSDRCHSFKDFATDILCV